MRNLVLVVASLCLAACATRLQVQDISGLKTGEPVAGIPFRVREPRTVRVWMRQSAEGDKPPQYKQVFVRTYELPDSGRLYALNFEASLFGRRDVKVVLREDGALGSVSLKGEDKTGEALAAASKQSLGLADAVVGFEAKQREAQLAALQGRTSLEKAQAEFEKAQRDLAGSREQPSADQNARLVAALEAFNAAQEAERALGNLKPEAPAADRAAAEDKLRLAQLKANQAYRRAGLAEPFPGVFP
jgi:hypothetical protein